MDNFWKYWFSGFQASLNQIDENSRKQIFKECGKACSNSYTKQVYLNAKNNSGNEEEFIEELRKAFPEIEIEVIEKEHLYQITYKYCACDLVTKKYINTPYLCECSKNSLLYNWEVILGEGNVKVESVQTILAGAPCCQFKVILL
jgi:hypothetical protein